MPYLKQHEKDLLVHIEAQIVMTDIDTPAKLNYLTTLLVRQAMKDKLINYTLLNGIVGALECSKEEFKQRILNPYERKKRKENGDCYL